MALSIETMQSLLAKSDPTEKTNALVMGTDGKLHKQLVKPSAFGKFEGKTGTKRRSRKGLVSVMPNGSRFYVRNFDTEVVAYKV